jgi:hypothetical protein
LAEKKSTKELMKKLMLILAIAGLVAGCANNRGTGGSGDENEMNSGSSSSDNIALPKQGSGNTYDSNSSSASEPGQPRP